MLSGGLGNVDVTVSSDLRWFGLFGVPVFRDVCFFYEHSEGGSCNPCVVRRTIKPEPALSAEVGTGFRSLQGERGDVPGDVWDLDRR
jgi:hypothetical protein